MAILPAYCISSGSTRDASTSLSSHIKVTAVALAVLVIIALAVPVAVVDPPVAEPVVQVVLAPTEVPGT